MEHLKITEQTNEYAVVEGYGVLFNVKDLEGETFTPQTDYATEYIKGQTVYLDHAQDDIVEEGGTTYHLKGVRQPVGEVVGVDVTDAGLYFRLKLKKAAEYWDYVSRVLSTNKCGLSTGTAPHLMEKSPDGIIKMWHVKEISLTMTPAESRTTKYLIRTKTLDSSEAGEVDSDNPVSDSASASTETLDNQTEDNNMSDEILKALALLNQRLDSMETKETPVNDPGNTPAAKNVNVISGLEESLKYDHIDTQDLALAYETVKSFEGVRRGVRVSDALARQLVKRHDSAELTATPDGRQYSNHAKSFLQRLGGNTKANEINQSTLANYGDEWVGVFYSGRLWEKIRTEAVVLRELERAGSVMEAQPGAESIVFPLESTDPVWYKVAQSASLSSNPGGIPTNTVTASNLGTANKTMTLSKLGARVLWTGELEEDAVLQYVGQLRDQIMKSGAEYLDSALIDGDTATGATTNINDIAGTPNSTDWFLVWDGLRKLALVTNTANSASGTTLTIEDYLATAQLMGSAGINAIDRSKVVFLTDPSTHYKTLQLAEVKTRDIFSAPTVEGGMVTSIWGYRNIIAGQMCKAGGTGLSNSAGKVDVDNLGNNLYGQIIAFRPDQWRFAWRRRMKMETTRVPAADATEIVVMMRAGFAYRDTEASAITYNLTV